MTGGSRPSRGWELAAMAAVVVLLTAAVGTATNIGTGMLPDWGWLKSPAVIWSVVGVSTVLLMVFAVLQQRRPAADPAPSRPYPARPAEPALERIAHAVAAQWSREAELRGLHHPAPMPVPWSAVLPESGVPVDGGFNNVRAMLDGLPCPRLVLLGAPGAGKTALAVEVVRQLLTGRAPSDPVPVLLSVSTWNPAAEHLHTWIAARLEESYPATHGAGELAGRSLARLLVDSHQILPVLDGLDELPAEQRGPALRAINRAIARTAPFVLTCRVAEYHDALIGGAEPLAAATTITLCPVRLADVERYLTEGLSRPRRDRWEPVFAAQRRAPDGPLAQSLTVPLMTGLARIAYSDTAADPTELLQIASQGRDTLDDHLLDQLIPAVYPAGSGPDGQPGRWDAGRAERSLRLLARHLHQLGRRDLAWWHLYQAIPPDRFSLVSGLTSGLLVAVLLGVLGAVLSGPEDSLVDGLRDATFGLMFGLATRLAVQLRPHPHERSRVRARLLRQSILGTVGGLAGGFAYAVTVRPTDGTLQGLLFGLSDGAVVGLVVGLAAALEDPSRPARLRGWPRGLHRHLARPMFVGVIFGLAIAPLASSVIGPYWGLSGGLAIGSVSGLAVAFREALAAPSDVTRASSPAGVWRADWAATAAYAMVAGLLGGATLGAVAAVVTGPRKAVGFAVIFGVVYALATAMFTATPTFLVARLCLLATDRMPWSLLDFLADAHRRGVLRQVGAVYQFRHARLQDRLAVSPTHKSRPTTHRPSLHPRTRWRTASRDGVPRWP